MKKGNSYGQHTGRGELEEIHGVRVKMEEGRRKRARAGRIDKSTKRAREEGQRAVESQRARKSNF